jgi:hypothetical protein
MRRCVQGYLDEQSPGGVTEPVVDSKGRVHTHQRLHSRTLTTIFGAVLVKRLGYGGRGLKSLHPLDAKLNLPPETYSHSLRRRVAEAVAKESYDEVISSIEKQTGVRIPRRQIEQLACRAAQDFNLFYETQRSQSARDVKKTGPIAGPHHGWERNPDAQDRSAGIDSQGCRRTKTKVGASAQ